MNKTIIHLCLFALLFPLMANAQKDNKAIKWGKILPADLEMSTYTADTQAAAVILTDVGFITVNVHSGLNYRFRHHRRIKILKEAGFAEATIELPFYTGQDPEKITGLKAQIILPNGEKYNVPRKDIFEEEVQKNWTVKKFTFPKLQEGAIIEYRYDLTSERILQLQDWNFQHDLPVRYSELVVEIPSWLEYVYLFNGLQDRARKKVVEGELLVVEGNEEDLDPLEGDASVKIDKNSFVMENIPAIQREPYMTTVDDYRASIRFQLSKLNYPDGRKEHILSSWEDTAKELLEDENFGQQFLKKRNYKKILEDVAPKIAGINDEMKKMEILCKFVSSNVKWNGKYRMFVPKSLNNAYEIKSAPSGTINMMLLALMRYAGMKASPVLVSTRQHGKMIQQYPIVDQFNHMIVLAEMNGKKITLDITDPIRPMGYPDIQALNSYGWKVDKETPQWIAIEAPGGSDMFMVNANLDEDGRLSGIIKGQYNGYNAVPERKNHQKSPMGQHWQGRLGANAQIDSMSVENLNVPEKRLKEKFYFELEDAAMVTGSMIYFTPIFYSNFNEQMFRLENRDFPVDIPYPFKEQFVIKVKIPDGYEVEEIPERKRVIIVNNGGEFNFLCEQKGSYIQVLSKIQIRQLKYQPEEYDNIKEFFERITEKLGEQIVLKKTEG
ncbi:MAG: DUF3857 domain-containing protein [Bacteroidota bacterium]